jgi:hypothetical protein
MFDKLKNALLSKLLSSFLPKYVRKYEGDIRRVVLAANMVIAALRVALPLIPDATEQKLKDHLDYIEGQYRKALALLKDYTGLDLSEVA